MALPRAAQPEKRLIRVGRGMVMKKALYILDRFVDIYAPAVQEAITGLVDVYAPPQGPDIAEANPELLRDVELIFSGWGAPKMNAVFLGAAPKLEAVFYGSGTIRGMVTDAFWKRNIIVSSAWPANAVPVSEYTLSQILSCLKRVPRIAQAYRQTRHVGQAWDEGGTLPGAYGTTVGIISLGMIGRLVAERLKPFDIHVTAYDPFVSEDEAQSLGVELVSLEEVFRRSDVVSLHAPWLKGTEGMITGEHIAAMKHGATFINTSRGAIVRETELAEVLGNRPDLFAVLDVTFPEPPPPESPLWELPNVLLTPHIAGSMGAECFRMGAYMLEELRRYLAGEPLKWQITEQRFKTMA